MHTDRFGSTILPGSIGERDRPTRSPRNARSLVSMDARPLFSSLLCSLYFNDGIYKSIPFSVVANDRRRKINAADRGISPGVFPLPAIVFEAGGAFDVAKFCDHGGPRSSGAICYSVRISCTILVIFVFPREARKR